jgi:CheY-like chemotaxis protein
MVFGIVQRHSGSLDIRSERGKGTTFVITFPLQEAAHSAGATTALSRTTNPLRVLVVDDEAPVRDTLAAILATDGHEVDMAADGLAGLKRFIAGKFDLVIADKAMPTMNGDQMASAIKRVAPKTPIILLTGFGLFHEKDEFPDIDVLASKPIRIPALREAVAAAVSQS